MMPRLSLIVSFYKLDFPLHQSIQLMPQLSIAHVTLPRGNKNVNKKTGRVKDRIQALEEGKR
jgi:hypothetical protein